MNRQRLLVVALLLAFVVAQLTVMFGGHDYLRRTTGLTYAEYVHQGFGQLTVATMLTLPRLGQHGTFVQGQHGPISHQHLALDDGRAHVVIIGDGIAARR